MVIIYKNSFWVSTGKTSVSELARIETIVFKKAIENEYKIYQSIYFHKAFDDAIARGLLSKN